MSTLVIKLLTKIDVAPFPPTAVSGSLAWASDMIPEINHESPEPFRWSPALLPSLQDLVVPDKQHQPCLSHNTHSARSSRRAGVARVTRWDWRANGYVSLLGIVAESYNFDPAIRASSKNVDRPARWRSPAFGAPVARRVRNIGREHSPRSAERWSVFRQSSSRRCWVCKGY